ncbi:TD and POZ domain-containing protein 2 [Frankliniella fusca]|uniref:TD and POZ domain-containing protein 2 n=1 Tax=Frankliniella fusca TaxID=407009 RepID=A0AAE1GXJ9_9NEOP|nr:TD and POZ domain-containing protein 2 [Frankliniella fusca]
MARPGPGAAAAEALNQAVSRFSRGEDQSVDILMVTATSCINVDDVQPGDEVEVSHFQLSQPRITWTMKLLVADTGVMRVVIDDVSAEDLSRLLLRGTVSVQSRLSDQDDVVIVNDVESQAEVEASAGGAAATPVSPPPPSPGSFRHQRIVVDAGTEGPATIASMHLSAACMLRVTMHTFYYHPARPSPSGDEASSSSTGGSSTDSPEDTPEEEIAVDVEVAADPNPDVRMLSKLSADLGQLLRTQTEADVTLVVEELPVHAHRAVLAARSDVFRRLLQRLQVPGERLELADVPRQAFLKLLDFVYTGDASGLGGLEQDVLVLAGRFGLADLADACCRRLLRELRRDHSKALDMLVFAERHRVHRLKQRALLIAVEHLCEVTASQQWHEYKHSVPSLAADLLETAAHVLSKP